MERDYKEVFNEEYYNAIEDGKTEDEAAKIAQEKVIDYWSSMADDLRDRLKYER